MMIVISQILISTVIFANETGIGLREDFNNLNQWKSVTFPKIKAHTQYEIAREGDKQILTARSRASASGIAYKGFYDPYKYPILHWRWKVDNIYTDANPNTKAGDDYPLRVYVIFEYDPNKAGTGMRIKYELAKKIYGEYPPWATLNYVWANKPIKKPFYDNPYTDRSKMFPLQGGKIYLGQWIEEEVNVMADYRKAFGQYPPSRTTLAIMNDSDNTGQAAVSHIDFIEARSEKSTESKDKTKKGT